MSPDKLFNYLDGKLSPSERADLEAALVSSPELQRELSVARRIHSGMEGESRELILTDDATAERGRKLALRVGMFFIILMAINVGAGLWIIAHKRASNPNRPLLEKQTRDQITKSLEQAAASALAPTPSLGVTELTVSVAAGKMNSVADDVVNTATRVGGSATKGIPDPNQISVLADIPGDREHDFRAAIATMTGAAAAGSPAPSATPGAEKQSFVIHIVEPEAK